MPYKNIMRLLHDAMHNFSADCLEVSHYLSDHPELSCQEEKSCAYLVSFLEKFGYTITSPYGGISHSFKASKKKQKVSVPKVAILCEYDALPDIGHACGHSVSCACSILAAMALENAFPDLPLQIDIIGTPAEELGGGKIIMARNGAFEGYDFAAMTHLFSHTTPFFSVLAVSDMQVTFHGKNAHASSEPWAGNNALNGVQLFFHALDMLRQHVTPDSQIHGVITNGGLLPSIVPDKASCYVYARANSMKKLDALWERMANCAKGAAQATETTCDITTLEERYADLYTGPAAARFLTHLFSQLEIPFQPGGCTLGSTDAGNLDVFIPTFHPGVGIGNDPSVKLHSREFAELVRSDAATTTLHHGALIIASICAALAYDSDLLATIKKEHALHRK